MKLMVGTHRTVHPLWFKSAYFLKKISSIFPLWNCNPAALMAIKYFSVPQALITKILLKIILQLAISQVITIKNNIIHNNNNGDFAHTGHIRLQSQQKAKISKFAFWRQSWSRTPRKMTKKWDIAFCLLKMWYRIIFYLFLSLSISANIPFSMFSPSFAPSLFPPRCGHLTLLHLF